MERKVSSGAINNGFNWGSQITYPTTQYLAVPPGVGTANMIPSSLIKLNVVSSTRGTFVSISGIRGGGGFWKQHGMKHQYCKLQIPPHLTIQWHLSIKLTRLYLYFSNMCLICEQLRWKFWTISAKPNKGSGEIITPSYLSKWRKWRRQLSAPVVILKRVIKVLFTSFKSEALPSHSFNILVF